jgi:transposase InsO family protein
MAGLLKLAKLPRSTFYYQQQALQAADKYHELKEQIRTLFDRHKGRYGYRRITAGLRQLGGQANHKTVQRLMGVLGLKSLVRPKKYRSFKGKFRTLATKHRPANGRPLAASVPYFIMTNSIPIHSPLLRAVSVYDRPIPPAHSHCRH